MACYKSALIDLDRRWANKGQDMTLYITQKDLDEMPKMDFTFSKDALKKYQPNRLRRVDTGDSEAIVGSANIDEIAESSRND